MQGLVSNLILSPLRQVKERVDQVTMDEVLHLVKVNLTLQVSPLEQSVVSPGSFLV